MYAIRLIAVNPTKQPRPSTGTLAGSQCRAAGFESLTYVNAVYP